MQVSKSELITDITYFMVNQFDRSHGFVSQSIAKRTQSFRVQGNSPNEIHCYYLDTEQLQEDFYH